MAAAGVQTTWTVLGLHLDSAWTYPGLKGRGFFFWKGLRTVLGLSSDSTQTDWTPLRLSSESLRIGGCRVKYCLSLWFERGRFRWSPSYWFVLPSEGIK